MAVVSIQGSTSLALGLGSVTGAIQVSWPSFTDADGLFHVAGSFVVPITAGNYSFTLGANESSVPTGTYYTATYFVGNTQFTESWNVPASASPLTIQQIRLNPSVPAPPNLVQASQIYSASANVGDVLVWNGQGYTPTTIQEVFSFEFTAQTNVPITQVEHAQGTSLFVRVYDSQGNQLDPDINVNPVSGDVLIAFGQAASGYGFIYGGLGRSLPNFTRVYLNRQSIVIPQSLHRFNTPNLDVAIYDPNGNLIDGQATVQISPTFDITVSFGSALTFKVVVLGCLGTTANQSSGVIQQATASLNVGAVSNQTVIVAGTISLVGAALGNAVSVAANPPLATGVTATAKVTAANVVSIEVQNLSGATVTPGSTVFTVCAFL